MLVAEILAVVAVAIQFLLPSDTFITISIAHQRLGLPIRWVVPLLLIAMAGALSLTALLAMYWRLAHVAIVTTGR
jgi:hypothetical protein